MIRWCLLLLVFPMFLSSAHCAPPAPVEEINLAIWCEFLPYAQVREHLPLLAQSRCDLILHVERGDVGSEELAALCREAKALGVEVVAWLLLPYEEHLYVGEESLETTRALAFDFLEWSGREQLGVSNMVFDCEPSPLLGRQLFEAVRRGRIIKLARLLKAEKDPVRFQQSVKELNGLVDDLRARGFRIWGAGNRVFLDFLARGQTSIEDALNAPFTMVEWDRISFLAYRYRASQVDYVAMINRYALLGRKFFGERAGLDVGLMGDHRQIPENTSRAELFGGGEFFMKYLEGMRSVLDLREIVSVARAAGIRDINLYSLDGAVDSEAGLELWLKAAREARPASRQEAWTPVRSAKLGLTAKLLRGAYRVFVGAEQAVPARE